VAKFALFYEKFVTKFALFYEKFVAKFAFLWKVCDWIWFFVKINDLEKSF
jgi:hypothetical protein